MQSDERPLEHAYQRRLPIGAEVVPGAGVHFRVWAPRCRSVQAIIEAPHAEVELERDPGGYFSGLAPGVGDGARYRLRLDGERLRPDPASRFQPEGPHGPSQVVDASRFRWTDAAWAGVSLRGRVLYELHVGTFTPQGTWQAAAEHLGDLAALGIHVVEVMPVAEFPGRFGWGYDGVDLYAPTRLYGTPDDFRRFVDRAHALGIGVILDVVYNHLGPDGNYLRDFSDHYFTERHKTDWGEPLDFDGPASAPVRELIVENAGYWIAEFHLDGLRLDATQCLYDRSPEHIVAAVTRRVREMAGTRRTIVVAENEAQTSALVRPTAASGYGADAVWNDDFHHSAMVAMTGRRDAYYTDYAGAPQEFISAAKHGFLYQGQRYVWQDKRRGTPTTGVPPEAFVAFLENHDQVSNSARGERLHQLAGPGRHRAMTGLLLLGPWTPMLFQGQEFSASSPFLYFADHHPELMQNVRRGRVELLTQFRAIAQSDVRDALPDPGDRETFQRCKLDLSERRTHAQALALHRDLIALRLNDPVIRLQGECGVDGAVLGPEAFVLRLFSPEGTDRLLVVNLGADLRLEIAPEPLLAPPAGHRWATHWSSEDPRYGGGGTPDLDTDEGWRIPGRASVLLAPIEAPREG